MDFWRLFDTSDFPARWNCGRWSDLHGWLHILSDLGIWAAYFAIPCVLIYFSLQRRDLPFRGVFVLFGAFILLCGTTHLMDAVIFWWPAYRLAALIKGMTAIVSWVTVLALIRVVPEVLAMRSPEELQREIDARRAAEEQLQIANEALERRVEQRTAELAATNASLRTEREWFRTTIASIGDGVITTDLEGAVTTMNRVAEQLVGWSRQEALGQRLDVVFNIVNEASRLPVENPALRALQDGVIVGLANHTVLIARDGTERHIDDSAAPIQDDEGKTHGAVLVFRDVSEKYVAASKVRESEALFVQLADAIPQLAWMAQPDGNIDWYNSRWYEYTGTTPDKMAGWGWQSVHDPETLPRVVERWKASLESGEPFSMVFPLRGADAEFRPFLTRVVPFRNERGAIVRWFGTNTDIGDISRAQDALRDSEEKLRLALNAGGLGSWHIEPETMQLRTDHRFREIFGVGGDNFTLEQAFEIVHQEDRDRIRSAVEAAMRIENTQPYDVEHRVARTDGSVRWIHATGQTKVIETPSGPKLSAFAGTVMDVTEDRRLRDELREIASRLSESNRRKDEFLATLAHELRNPLAPIRTGLEALELVDDDAELRAEIRRTMERQAEQMVRLIDDLLDVSRITLGKLQLRLGRVELADVVTSSVEATRPFIDAARHDLTVSLPDHPIVVHGDPARLAQVLSNLLNNAAKYTTAGGRIRLTVERQNDEAVISVSDNGVGIPAEMKDHIFEMFGQVDRDSESGHGGLGIGLTLVKTLVEMHGGTIEVRSEGADRGSEFSIRLPIFVEESASESTALGDAPLAVVSPIRVLVVDDNQAAANMLSMVVRKLGNEVRTAYDGERAIELAAEFLPQIVLMDLGMPKVNGYEAARRIRERDWGKDMTLVALTGWGQEEDKQRSKQAGFDHHLVKPADPLALRQLLASFRPPSG